MFVKQKYGLLVKRDDVAYAFIFEAKCQNDAIKIADEEFKKWKNASSYRVYELGKFKKEPELVLPFMESHKIRKEDFDKLFKVDIQEAVINTIKSWHNDKVDITELLTYIELDVRGNRQYEDSPFKQFFKRDTYYMLREALFNESTIAERKSNS